MAARRGPSAPQDRQAAHDRLEERITGRLDDTIQALAERVDSSFGVVLKGMGELQADLRRGQMDRSQILSRLGELEMQVGENRDAGRLLGDRLEAIERAHLVDTKAVTKQAIVEAAPAAAANATRAAPKELWHSLTTIQKAVAVGAGCVAILAGFSGALTGLERLVKAGWAGASTAWSHAKAETDFKGD